MRNFIQIDRASFKTKGYSGNNCEWGQCQTWGA